MLSESERRWAVAAAAVAWRGGGGGGVLGRSGRPHLGSEPTAFAPSTLGAARLLVGAKFARNWADSSLRPWTRWTRQEVDRTPGGYQAMQAELSGQQARDA